MRFLVLLGLLALGASVFWAPRYFSDRDADRREAAMYDLDSAERIRRGKEAGALGVTLAGYLQADPNDPDTIRGQFETTLKLWAYAVSQPGFDKMVRDAAALYLQNRQRVDPKGELLQKTLRFWIKHRLEHPGWFYAKAAPAIFLAARGDKQGLEKLFEFVKQGPFYREFFLYTRRVHPGWGAVGPVVKYYIEKGGLAKRIAAGATLLEYNNYFGYGQELLDQYRTNILGDLKEGLAKIRRGGNADEALRQRGEGILYGLALCGEEGRELLESVPEIDMDEYIVLFRCVRMLARVAPKGKDWSFYTPGSTRWGMLDSHSQRYYFWAVLHRYVQHHRGADADPKEVKEVRKLVDAALATKDTVLKIHVLSVLASLDKEWAEKLMPRYLRGGGVPSIYAAGMMPMRDSNDTVDLLLPAISSAMPDYASLAAVAMLDMDGPPPLPVVAK